MLPPANPYAPIRRTRLLLLAAALVPLIAAADAVSGEHISFGVLYLFPILIASGYLERWQILVLTTICAFLHVWLSEVPTRDTGALLLMVNLAYAATGLFVLELASKRQKAIEHVEALHTQIRLREDAERQLRLVIETSPAAILTMDSAGTILISNEAANALFTSDATGLAGQSIEKYVPALQSAAQRNPAQTFRTTMQCKARMEDGELFHAAVWFSSFSTIRGRCVAAIIVDVSEDLREHENQAFSHSVRNARILMSGISHEIRNVCAAISVAAQNLARVGGLDHDPDLRSLGALVGALERLSSFDLIPAPDDDIQAVDLDSVLDDVRVLMATPLSDAGIQVSWAIPEELPLVWADPQALLQVFINLLRNSRRAIAGMPSGSIQIHAEAQQGRVIVRVTDSGPGVADPGMLFHPFHKGSDENGLGLYVSRAIMRSLGGDLVHEQTECGCCFAVSLACTRSQQQNA